MKILNVQEYRKTQYDSYRKRRTSQFIKFLDKNVDFVTYFSINKAESTYSLENQSVDSYIGKDSPIRYNKIYNLPVYGFPIISNENDFDIENGGLSNEGYEGELIFLPEIIEPSEGDVFILDIFNQSLPFIINTVTQTVLKSKPHYVVRFHAGVPDYLPQLQSQVVGEYNAIFDNIGTQDKVIISNNDYDLNEQYKDIYKTFNEYYKSAFFKSKLTLFETELDQLTDTGHTIHYIDKFLHKFMEENRIVIMDSLLRDNLIMDYNNLFDDNDFRTYKKSLYWAIINKDISSIPDNVNFTTIRKINSPFTVIYATHPEWYFTGEDFITKKENSFGIEFNIEEIVNRYISRDTSIDGNKPYTRVLSMIVNYLYGNHIAPGYFEGIIGELSVIQEYELIPIIMYIIREQMNSLTKTGNIL